jgi:hypothetical protein
VVKPSQVSPLTAASAGRLLKQYVSCHEGVVATHLISYRGMHDSRIANFPTGRNPRASRIAGCRLSQLRDEQILAGEHFVALGSNG